MASPFSTIEAFQEAIEGPTQGAIYTFAHTPAVNTIALIFSVLLFGWFMVRLWKRPRKQAKFDKSLGSLSLVIVTGLLSLLGPEKMQPQRDFMVADKAAIETQAIRPQALETYNSSNKMSG
ncbi:MAG: hypothetical protein AAGC93_14975 [Cyanobacteria bacterium P01_F01_bin.53]